MIKISDNNGIGVCTGTAYILKKKDTALSAKAGQFLKVNKERKLMRKYFKDVYLSLFLLLYASQSLALTKGEYAEIFCKELNIKTDPMAKTFYKDL